jgi:hypothetical protein
MSTLPPPARAFAVLVSCLLLAVLAHGTAAHAGPIHPGADHAPFQLLPPIQDPDDDDDGVVDELDPEPANPDVAPTAEPDITSPIQDSDGDGLPNVQDPDDDNAGVSDQEDPAPFDPTIEPTPVPGPLSPIHDDDGDGIPNIQDPDDDNDGASDDEDPGAPDPAPVVDTGGYQPVASVGTDTALGGAGDAPLVTALPSTGSGPAPSVTLDTLAMALAVTGILVVASLRLWGRERA